MLYGHLVNQSRQKWTHISSAKIYNYESKQVVMEAEQMMLALLGELIEGRNHFLSRGVSRIGSAHRRLIY